MKKIICWLALLLCLCSAQALASSTLQITTDASIQGITLIDDSGSSVGTATGWTSANGYKTWVFQLENTASKQATLFVKTANGSWQNTYTIYPLSSTAAGSSTQSQPAAAKPTQTSAGDPWPENPYSAKSASVKDLPSDKRHQSRCGPAKSYHGAGGYKSYKVSSIKAFFIEDGYVYADLNYTTVGRRRLYFPESVFRKIGSVPEVTLRGYSARTTEKLIPRFGPGGKYDEFSEARINAGTSLQVFFEEDGWVFAEFDCNLGPVRAWIKESQVKAQ